MNGMAMSKQENSGTTALLGFDARLWAAADALRNNFWVPREARWAHLKGNAAPPTIGTLVDDAMSAIERDNPSLKFAWVQHFILHLAPTGLAGFVLANGSMSSNQSGEGEIRKNIRGENDAVDGRATTADGGVRQA